MKILTGLLPLLLAASGCSRNPEVPQAPAAVIKPISIQALTRSTEHDVTAVLAAASSLIERGRPLETEVAERCWKAESGRPEVRAACALAWSTGESRSSSMEAAIASLAPKSRSIALAAIRNGHPFAHVGLDALTEMLSTLSDDPVWLRARAITVWRQHHPLPDRESLASLLRQLRPESSHWPADFRFALLAAGALQQESLDWWTEGCQAQSSPELRLPCWRQISAFVDDKGAGELPASWRAWLGNRADGSWALFRFSFPERAILISKFF